MTNQTFGALMKKGICDLCGQSGSVHEFRGEYLCTDCKEEKENIMSDSARQKDNLDKELFERGIETLEQATTTAKEINSTLVQIAYHLEMLWRRR